MAQPHSDVDSWPAGAGGFRLSPEEANAVLAQALSAEEKLQQLVRQANILEQIGAAANDPASLAYNARLVGENGVAEAARDHLNAESAYLRELIAKIEAAVRLTGEHDSEAARAVAGTPNRGLAG